MFIRLHQPLFLSPEAIQLNATLHNWYRLRIYILPLWLRNLNMILFGLKVIDIFVNISQRPINNNVLI